MLDSDKSSYVEKKKQLNKNRHDKGTYFVISAAAAAAAEAVAFSAANKFQFVELNIAYIAAWFSKEIRRLFLF